VRDGSVAHGVHLAAHQISDVTSLRWTKNSRAVVLIHGDGVRLLIHSDNFRPSVLPQVCDGQGDHLRFPTVKCRAAEVFGSIPELHTDGTGWHPQETIIRAIRKGRTDEVQLAIAIHIS